MGLPALGYLASDAVTRFLSRRYPRRPSAPEMTDYLFFYMITVISRRTIIRSRFGANMGEVIQFVPKSERERIRLIREARAMYDSVFPPADPASGPGDGSPAAGGTNIGRGDGGRA